MKSPTSLIRFRNAVGVLLALSAVFAVVISTITVTQDRALGQATTPVSVNLPDAAITVGEADGTASVTVTLGTAVDGDDVTIPIKVEDGTAMASTAATGEDPNNDYVTPDPSSVTLSDTDTTGTLAITIVNPTTADDEPQESFTVSLDTASDDWPSGYAAGDNASVMVIINDDDNVPHSGSVTITIPDGDDADTDPDTPTGGLVGQTLTADTSGVTDGDHVDNAATTNVDESVLTDGFTFQWIRIKGTGRDTDPLTAGDIADDEVGDQKTYTPVDEDVGRVLALEVTWSDMYGNGDAEADDVTVATTLAETVYDEARPFIIIGELVDDEAVPPGDDRLAPGVVLTADWSGITFNGDSQLLDGDGEVVMKNAATADGTADNMVAVLNTDVTLTWYRGDDPIICDANDDGTTDEDEECTTGNLGTIVTTARPTYTLTADDIRMSITLRATYENPELIDDPTDTTNTPPKIIKQEGDPPANVTNTELFGKSDYVDMIHGSPIVSPASTLGAPTVGGTAQVGSPLTAGIGSIADRDATMTGYPKITKYQWIRIDDDDNEMNIGTDSPSYTLAPSDVGHTIKVHVTVEDGTRDYEVRPSGATTKVVGSPGVISRIEGGIRSVTVSAGDTVVLSVNVFGLQDKQDQGLSGNIRWSSTGGGLPDANTGASIIYTAPSAPSSYEVIATVDPGDCQPILGDRTDAVARAEDCSAKIIVNVRRPAAGPDPAPAPQDPPGEIPTILTDADGNQYEVFTPEGGGAFVGEGYSLTAGAGAIPNGEYIGIRVSDEGSASNAGMTHQRYTLGGNMYEVSAVDATNNIISSYVLNSAATACLPLPDELRTNISDLAIVAINPDDTLTILSASVRLGNGGGAHVCGSLSGIPATLAVGSEGAPAPLPTPTPEPEPEIPETGGTAPSSNAGLWALLLGAAIVTFGTLLVFARRRESARK